MTDKSQPEVSATGMEYKCMVPSVYSVDSHYFIQHCIASVVYINGLNNEIPIAKRSRNSEFYSTVRRYRSPN